MPLVIKSSFKIAVIDERYKTCDYFVIRRFYINFDLLPLNPLSPLAPGLPAAPAAPVAPRSPGAPRLPDAPGNPLSPRAPGSPVAPLGPSGPDKFQCIPYYRGKKETSLLFSFLKL